MLYQFHSEEFSQSLPLQLWMFGVNHRQEQIHRPNGVSYYQWFYCVRGQGELIINNQRCLIAENQGFLIYPDVAHFYQGLTKDWTLHILAFNGAACKEILQSLRMDRSGVYHFSDSFIFEKHIQNLYWLHENRSSDRAMTYSKECYDFLLDISRCISPSSKLVYVQDNVLILKIITYLDRNYQESISLDSLASVVHLSKDYMCALFKKATGQTIIRCLTNIRIGQARQKLMQYPDLKILDIARQCGFESPSYFGKIFKREVGMTPEQYRKTM